MVEGILVEGLIYGIMVLGVFITFRILDFPDLTVDGSFPMGAAVMASMTVGGFPLLLGLLVAFLCGLLAGSVTALIHNKLKVPNLLAGILTMTMLYSVNIRILGNRANLPLLKNQTILTHVTALTEGWLNREYTYLVFFVIVVIAVVDVDFAFTGKICTGDKVEEGGLPRPIAADDGNEIPHSYGKVDIVNRQGLIYRTRIEYLDNVLQSYHRFARFFIFTVFALVMMSERMMSRPVISLRSFGVRFM